MHAIEWAIRSSWSADTSDHPDDWRPDNPARGHCGTTAFVLRDLLGGDVVVAQIVGTDPQEHHSWNRFPSGFEMDLTRDQFPEPPELLECEIPETMLVKLLGAQADLLRSRVLELLATVDR
jgi:hypothetical protein